MDLDMYKHPSTTSSFKTLLLPLLSKEELLRGDFFMTRVKLLKFLLPKSNRLFLLEMAFQLYLGCFVFYSMEYFWAGRFFFWVQKMARQFRKSLPRFLKSTCLKK